MEPQEGLAETFTENVPRLPEPFFAVTETWLDPLPSIRESDNSMVRLFPLPSCAALRVRTPDASTIVKVAVAVRFVESPWLSSTVFGLIDAEH